MPLKKSESGMSLIETLIGIGLLVVVIVGGMKMLLNAQKSQKQLENRLNVRFVARTIETLVDCKAIPTTCTSGDLLDIKKRGGAQLIDAKGRTQIAGWTVRALCLPGNQISFQAARESSEGVFFADPFTQDLLDWDHPKSKLFPEKYLCSTQFMQSLQSSAGMDLKIGTTCLVDDDNHIPCNPTQPPACDPGFISRGLTLDTFGGTEGGLTSIFGQRWLRYCIKLPT